MTPRDWHQSERALRLLAEIDAAERSSDRYLGLGWSDIAERFGEKASELENDLDDIRREALDAFAGTVDPTGGDDFHDAWDEADSEALTVAEAVQSARRNHLGSNLLEEAA
jgi:hypothetical protein